MMRTLIAIAALGLILAGCDADDPLPPQPPQSELKDPVETYECCQSDGCITVIYDSSSLNATGGGDGGVSICGGGGSACRSTRDVLKVGEVISFSIKNNSYILDRGDSTFRYRPKSTADENKYTVLNCMVVPNGTE
jgi:hypothetical protein